MNRCGVILLLSALFSLATYTLLAWLIYKAVQAMVWLM